MPALDRLATRSLPACLTACAMLGSGCASLVSSPSPTGTRALVDLERPELREFPVAAMTDLERDVRLETSDRKHEKLTPALFWTGIAFGSLGAVGVIAFGSAGFVTKNHLNQGYEQGLTLDERDELRSRGELHNTLAISSAVVMVLGYALAIVTYGVDWNRCGPLVEKRRKCKELFGE